MSDNQSYASRMENDSSTLAMWKDHRQEGIDNCAPKWKESSRLKRFAARDQWPDEDRHKTDNPNRKSARITVPETSRVLAAFSGKQVLQRLEREYIPRNEDAARYAEVWTKVDRAICQACDGEQVDSAAFRDGPGIQGISWVRWYVDDWTSEIPQLKYETVPIWQMMWPATRLINLQDRAWQRWGSWWPQSTVRARWRQHYDAIRTMIGTQQWTDMQQKVGGVHSRIPWIGGPGNKPLTSSAADAYDPRTRSLWIEYEEYRELRTYFRVARPIDPNMTYAEALDVDRQRIMRLSDPMTAQSAPPDAMERIELSPDELPEFRREHQSVHSEDVPNDLIERKQRMEYRYIFGCGDVILEEGEVEQGCFTFQALAAEVVELENETKYISLMSDLVDAQRMVNYMMSALIRDIQIHPKGGLIVEQGLFRDKNEALAAWTAPGGVIEVPRGRLSQGTKPYDLVPNPPGQYETKLQSMLAFYREAIPRLAGFNPAALGQLGTDIRRVSGEVVRQLADATMTSNAERIDSFRLYRREGARIFMAFARKMWQPEDLVRFIGESDAYDDVLDPMTAMPTGERVLAIPPKEAWNEDYWKEIAIEEVQPGDDQLSAFWDKVQTQVALLQAPMPDTGQPLFQSEDWVKLLQLPASMRQKLLARIKAQQRKLQQEQMMAQQQAQQAQEQGQMPPPDAGAAGANGAGAPVQ